MTTRIYAYLALVVVLLAAAWAIHAWDKGRISSAHEAGVQQERAAWVARQAETDRKAAQDERDATHASEGATDTAKADNAAQAAAADATTRSNVKDIQDAYRQTPTACVPAPLPDVVRDRLRQARADALGHP